MRLACIVALIGCASPRPVERGTAFVSPRPELAASTKSDTQIDQRFAPRERPPSECRHDSDCGEHLFGFCGYLNDDQHPDDDGARLAVVQYRGRACLYAKCSSSACRREALPVPSKMVADGE